MVKPFKAIAAMSLNRVIGAGNKIPWHLPEDFKWFKRITTGNVVIMGRKTFESIGKPLPNRLTVILSRTAQPREGVLVISDASRLDPASPVFAGRDLFVCGGAEIYRQLLPFCSDLFLTLVKREVQGDAFFPPFEQQFDLVEQLDENTDFRVLHYRNREVRTWSGH
jgi:dihydrofolate reductase